MITRRKSVCINNRNKTTALTQLRLLEEDPKPQITQKMEEVIRKVRRRYSKKDNIIALMIEELERNEERNGKIDGTFILTGEGFDAKTTNDERTKTVEVKCKGEVHRVIPITKENLVIIARDALREIGEEAYFSYGWSQDSEFEAILLARNGENWGSYFTQQQSNFIEVVSEGGIYALSKLSAGLNKTHNAFEKMKRKRKLSIDARIAGHLIFDGTNSWPEDRLSRIRCFYEKILQDMFFDKENVLQRALSRNMPREIMRKTMIKIRENKVEIEVPDCEFKEEIEAKIEGEFRVLRTIGVHMHSKEECRKVH